jgi:polyhydroxyalkanoate synthesis regulator phasin
MTDEQQPQGRRLSIGEGIRNGVGVLTAFKEAIEESIQEASARGDLSPERAKQFLGDALHRVQDTVVDVRDRLDVVPRREFDALQAEVAELRRRLDALTGGAASDAAPLQLSATSSASTLPAPEGPTEARMP